MAGIFSALRRRRDALRPVPSREVTVSWYFFMVFVPPVTPELEAGVVEKRRELSDRTGARQTKLSLRSGETPSPAPLFTTFGNACAKLPGAAGNHVSRATPLA